MMMMTKKHSSPTIISQEIIKPSSPTPSHLQTYNLSALDQFATKTFMPLVMFYPTTDCTLTSQDKARVLKISLSHCLTQYYPFASRMTTPATPYVDCNEEGVVFLEARIHTKLDTFLNLREQDETLYQLFANDLASYSSPSNASLVGVQLNHFACGGIGLAVSVSHIIGDACTLASFLTHWASLAHYGSTDLNPIFLHSPTSEPRPIHSQARARARALDIDHHTTLVTKKFVFPNSKLSDLKNKVASEGVNNPSRVEVLTSLLYKTAVGAATTIQGSFKPSYLFMVANVREKFVPKLPPATIGNLLSIMLVPTMHTSETSSSIVVVEMKKQKLQLEGIQSVQLLAENMISFPSRIRNFENIADGLYYCSSLCGFAFNKLDFGRGKPVGATYVVDRSSYKNKILVLMDTPDSDGIEAWVSLDKEAMEIFVNDN